MVFTTLGKYELLKELGRGGFGTVYRARDTTLDVERAVKILHPAMASDPDFITRFRREAITAAKLEHPNIVPVYELGEEQGSYFLVMKFIPGGSLKELLKHEGHLSFERALVILRQIGSALEFAHQKGLIHRDVKPGNILLEEDGTARLSDFGFSKNLTGNSVSVSGGVIGTPAYIPPEVWRGKPASPATDQYALACVFFEMLTGEVLFSGDSPPEVLTRHILDGAQFPAVWPQGVPTGITEVLRRALAKEPQDRYPDISAFGAACAGANEKSAKPAPHTPIFEDQTQPEEPIQTQPPPAAKAPSTFRRYLGVGAGLITIVVCLMAGLVSMFWLFSPIWEGGNSPTPGSIIAATQILPNMIDTDDMHLMYVPEGDFVMGSDAGDNTGKPVHSIYLDAFWIDQTEVTNKQYAECVSSGGCAPPSNSSSSTRSSYYGNPQFDNHPVIWVDWFGAHAYCEWAGRRLPTEAEWEKAASWNDLTQEKYVYPWGNDFNGSILNFCDKNCALEWADKNWDDGFADTSPVMNYPGGVSPYDAYDMSGNVFEWVNDWYGETYYQSSPSSNPAGPDSGEFRVVRGGAWFFDGDLGRSALRIGDYPTIANDNIGFRCALSRSLP